MSIVSRREFTTLAGLGGLGMVMGVGARQSQAETAADKRPNIIFLLTDDQRWDALGCMGNPIIQTPHLDRMAGEGVLFENAYVTTSICAPSRATILSGQYVRKHGIDNFAKTFSDDAWRETYPALLREAGYVTGFVGKYGVGTDMPEDRFDYWRGYAGQGHYEQEDENGNYIHLTQVHEEAALAFLRMHGDGTKPFCLSVSFKAPHCQDGDPRQFIYDPRYEDLYRDAVIPEPVTGEPHYFERFPEFFQDNNEARNRWEIRFSTPELYQEMVKGYYRLITGVDRVVGSLRDALDALGLADNTIIVFMSDNGFFLGDHGLAGKWYGYDPSIRVPLIIYDPRLPDALRGRRCSEIALNLDIAPTLLGMAGITPPSSMQGKDMAGLLRGESPEWREDFFYEHTFSHPGIPKSEGVAGGRYKYLFYFEQSPPYEELFDLEKDPLETNNLARTEAYKGVLEQMRARYQLLKRQSAGIMSDD